LWLKTGLQRYFKGGAILANFKSRDHYPTYLFLFFLFFFSLFASCPVFGAKGALSTSKNRIFTFSYQPYTDRISFFYTHRFYSCNDQSPVSQISIGRYLGFLPQKDNQLCLFLQFGGSDFVNVVSLGGPAFSPHNLILIDRAGYPVHNSTGPVFLPPVPSDCFYLNAWLDSKPVDSQIEIEGSKYSAFTPPFSQLGLFWISDQPRTRLILLSSFLGLPIVSISTRFKSSIKSLSVGIINSFKPYPLGIFDEDILPK